MQKTQKILVADDQPITRTLIEDILQEQYSIIHASNGRHALELINQEGDIDLILLDIIMPEMNGFEVCQELKKNPLTEDIPVIMLTIMDQDHNEAKGFDLGIADYISKPINRTKLLTRVKNQLELKRQRELLQKKNQELQDAIGQIKTLRGIVPICSFCKQIRNDKGYWQQVEEYIRNHSEAEFSHSVCPTCMKEQYGDEMK